MMFISKFNRLIRSKTLWLIFAAVIVCSFVFWGMNTGGIDEAEQNAVAGKLNGKDITTKEFRRAYFHIYFSTLMRFGREINIDEAMDKAINQMAFKRIAALRMAEKMKIEITDGEVAASIQKEPMFMEQGRFSRQRYEAFARNFLPQMGASQQFYEEHVRQELLLQKLRFMLGQAVWVTPFEVMTSFTRLYDSFVFSYVTITTDQLETPVDVDEAEARAFLEQYADEFVIPESMTVRYVTFPAANYLNKTSVEDYEIEDYYEENIDDYSSIDTNGFTTTVPVESVTNEIVAKLNLIKAMNAASDDATDFEMTITPNRDGNAPSFDEAALERKLNVSTSEVFSLRSPLKELDVDTDFNEAAFDLTEDPDMYFSRPIRGESNVYVMARETRTPARIPDFEEVEVEVMLFARQTKKAMALMERAEEIREEIMKQLDQGKTFAEAAKEFDLDVETTDEFTLSSDFEDESDDFYSVLRSIISLNPGELTNPIMAKRKAVLGYLDSRKPADKTTFDSMRQDIIRYIKRDRETVVFNDWEDYLLKSGDFEDTRRVIEPEESDQELESEEPYTDPTEEVADKQQ